MNKREIGDNGEKIAFTYLENKDYTILERNYIKNHGEIDIIAKKNNIIVFIEVKLRNNLNYGHPLESITNKKINKLKETSAYYLNEYNYLDNEVRFDVISILLENNSYAITHIENAF